ncbi:MAG: 6-aminohexanoate hydrolase, partial [Hyphomonas sp. 34-62-18]
MPQLTRRAALTGGAATLALAACSPKVAGPAPETATAAPGFRDGVAIAAAIASGETTALAEVEAAIARARAVEGQINGIVTETFEIARADAGGVLAGPFAGVPS